MASRPKFDCVCFDCDSTLTRIEGIDELARLNECEALIAPLTGLAMDGQLTLEEVYARRLDIVRPDRDALLWLSARYIDNIIPGARETIAALYRLGKAVHVVSGGLLQPVTAVARDLGIAPSFVHAVDVILDANGVYRGFDKTSPLTRSDGKAVICRQLADRHRSIALVGDGVTDLAARDAGAFVVGYGGVVARERVAQSADRYIDAPELTAVLAVLLTDDERALL